jgi:hypothetical protein
MCACPDEFRSRVGMQTLSDAEKAQLEAELKAEQADLARLEAQLKVPLSLSCLNSPTSLSHLSLSLSYPLSLSLSSCPPTFSITLT